MTINDLTPGSRHLFEALWNDKDNWSGTPPMGGNVPTDAAARGHLTHLKKLGLVTTFHDEGLAWVSFTPAGEELGQTVKEPCGRFVDQHGCPSCGASLSELERTGHRS